MGPIKKQYYIHNFYFQTAYETAVHIEEFIKDGLMKKEQQHLIEVSFDQFDDVVSYLISAVQMPSNELEQFIKKGAFTYEQVRNIAEACCIHELTVDKSGQLHLHSTVLSISALMSFAQSKWNGAKRTAALKNAVLTGMSVFGESFAEEVIFQQMESHDPELSYQEEKSITDVIAKNGTKSVAKKMATKFTKKAMLSSAVAKKTIMMLNANVVTGALVTGVMSTVDVVRAIKGQLSPQQLFKNVSKTAASVAGGIIGMLLFGGIGWNIPGVSTTVISLIGGIIGLIVGSILLTKIATKTLNFFIKEDSEKMLEIFNDVLAERTEAYLLNAEELQGAIEDFCEHYDMKKQLRLMYAEENHEAFARAMINRELQRIIKQRMYLHVPTDDEVFETLKHLERELEMAG